MQETLKMMKSILIGKESKVDEKKLIIEYKENLSPNILAYFYCDNFGIIYKTSKLYSLLSDEDKASFCLQELDKCLQNYNINGDAKFITYFIKCYKNRLRTEIQSLNYNKRKINILNDELNENIEDYEFEITDTNLILNEYNLTSQEKEFCKLRNNGYKLYEISNIFNLSLPRINQINHIIKQKILNSSIDFI